MISILMMALWLAGTTFSIVNKNEASSESNVSSAAKEETVISFVLIVM